MILARINEEKKLREAERSKDNSEIMLMRKSSMGKLEKGKEN